eukprot:4953886-Pyramimonas_sp.AAC.1
MFAPCIDHLELSTRWRSRGSGWGVLGPISCRPTTWIVVGCADAAGGSSHRVQTYLFTLALRQ